MAILIALIVFFIMCILMIIFMAKSQPPTAKDTVEAFCDALIRDDKKTLEAIASIKSVPGSVIEAVKSLKDAHLKAGAAYEFQSLKEYDTNDARYCEMVLISDNKNVQFKLVRSINRWMISEVS